MSVALVILRLEIADESECDLTSWNYSAPDYSLPSLREAQSGKSSKPSYAAVASCSMASRALDETQLQLNKEYRGLRELKHIRIETILNNGDFPCQKFDEDTNKSSSKGMASVVCDDITRTDCAISVDLHSKLPKSLLAGQGATNSRESSVTSEDSTLESAKCLSQEFGFRPISSRDSPSTSNGIGSRPGSGSIRPKSHSPTFKSPQTVHFFSGNPTVELTKGILHLYKDDQLTSLKDEVPRSELICMLAVPAAYTIHDLLDFTIPVNEGIEYIRIIRDATPNQYMVLIKFQNQMLADEFYNVYNNTPFNSIEPDICHLVFVAKVESLKESEGACLPVPGLTELPNCPVCLERMDESVDGILTILCNHAFHMTCLSQWGDTSCPVCRYCQTPEESADNRCMKCGSQESLWICLICGHIGCGRYVGLHAYRHFQDTQHTYAMQLGNNKVWDYAGDNYVHRLVQNKGDGKLVEVDEGGNLIQEEKLDSLTLEYTYLLTSQLESQRLYFEEKMLRIESDAQERVEQMEARYQKSNEDNKRLEARLAVITKDKQVAEKKCSQLQCRLTKVLTEVEEEREMNRCLLENQQIWQKRVTMLEEQVEQLTTTKEKEIQDLQDQLRDVMFYLEAQQKLASTTEVSQEEIQEGQVIMGATASPTSPTVKKTHKKRR